MENQPAISFKGNPFLVDCIQWSEDNQLVICNDKGVYIVTPILVGMLSTKEKYKYVGIILPPLERIADSVMITENDKVETSFLNEESFRLARWSPPNLSPNQSCFLTVVTTKHRVLLYQISSRDPTNSDWNLCVDLTDKIKDHAISHQHETRINPHHTLCASWSKRLIPNPLASKPALLATSNKAGDVCIWAYTDSFDYKTKITPHKSFVNLLEWTDWKKVNSTTYIAFIASACTDGTVAISSVQVKTSVVSKSRTTRIGDIKMKVLHVWFEEGDRAVTTLIKMFDDFAKGIIRIAISKGVRVQIICLDVKKGDKLVPKKDWQAYTLLSSGLGLSCGTWVRDDNNIVLFRGFTVEGECTYLKIESNGDVQYDKQLSIMWSATLVQTYKQQWIEEQLKADDDHILSASDAHPFLWGASDTRNQIFTALSFDLRPDVDIHYRGESNDSMYLKFILDRERGQDIESICQLTKTYLDDPYCVFVKPIVGFVRELLQYLVDDEDNEALAEWISTLSSDLNIEPTASSGSTLTEKVYCSTDTIAARMMINAQLELQNYDPLDFGTEYETTCQKARRTVQINYTNSILSHADQLPDKEFSQLTEQDIAALVSISDSALALCDKPLIKQALNVYVRIHDKFPQFGDLLTEIAYATTFSPESPPIDRKGRNKCPVCEKTVNLLNSGTSYSLLAQCEAGHFWEICSMTRTVLHSPKFRKCLVCDAKSLQPTDQDTLSNFILTNCCKCLYCGSGLINSR
ncbi:transcription factor IIIC subunit delta N-term-domain-containing protein [Parasitella parasitica]|nr:transcription factor IIIC subunit delta N-term-domain-containing protein [Parasitella parasitica]